jgi:hypothetical protein
MIAIDNLPVFAKSFYCKMVRDLCEVMWLMSVKRKGRGVQVA